MDNEEHTELGMQNCLHKNHNLVNCKLNDCFPQGWNDVGFRNPDVLTPNIDKLARSGMILNSSYVMPVCTP